MPQAQPQDNTVPFNKSIPTAVMTHPTAPFVERFVVPAAWFSAGFIIAKLLSRPTVIRGM